MKRLLDGETAPHCEVSQVFLTEMVHVAQPVSAAPPIQQVVAAIDILSPHIDSIPINHARLQALAVQEIPHREHEAPPLTGNQAAHLFGQAQAQGIARNVMQHGEGNYAIIWR